MLAGHELIQLHIGYTLCAQREADKQGQRHEELKTKWRSEDTEKDYWWHTRYASLAWFQ